LLDSDTLTPDQADSVRQILKAGRHLTQMIDEVLQVIRANAGAVPLSVEPLDLAQLVTEAVDLVRPSALRHSLQLTTTFPSPEQAWALGDRQKTTEILLNLLSNAVKYNREGGSIHVELSASDTVVRVSVTDTGFGLSPDQQSRLFNPFERLDAATRHIEGTGLGLALAKAMAELMNGTVGVESAVDRGSTFWFELVRTTPPMHRIADTDHDVTLTTTERDVTGTLLYVDDTPSNLLLIGRLLERRPKVVFVTAGSGSDGIRVAQTHRPDLILLDFHLPDMDAEEVMRRLSADPTTRGIPVVILTADATRRSGDHVIAGHSVECLSKPVDMPRFVALIDKLLARPAAG
jgi:CheY-like chemotaxis protein